MTDASATRERSPAGIGRGGPPERRRLRRFGITVGAAFLVLTAVLLWKHRPAWPVAAILGGLLVALGLLAPAQLRPIEHAWMVGARALGWVMTRVILGFVFVLVFTPAGLMIRLLRRDPLKLRRNAAARSYWSPREDHDRSPERMERMF